MHGNQRPLPVYPAGEEVTDVASDLERGNLLHRPRKADGVEVYWGRLLAFNLIHLPHKAARVYEQNNFGYKSTSESSAT